MTGRKTTFYAQAPDNTVLKRTSDKRIYTHAVLILVYPRTSKIQEFGYGERDTSKQPYWTAWRWSQSAANADKGVATLYSQPTYYQVEEVLVVEVEVEQPRKRQDEQLISQGLAQCEQICAASRRLNQSEWPQVVDEYVAFHTNDRRFHIYEATTLYIDSYVQEQNTTVARIRRGPMNFDKMLADPEQVRELIEVITS